MDERPIIVFWVSRGAASACALQLGVQKYGKTHRIQAVTNPVAEEDADNYRFEGDVERWTGVKIEQATNPKFPSNRCTDVWAKRGYMSGNKGAPCTVELKKEARYLWESQNKFDYLVLGFTVEEQKRHDDFVKFERSNLLPVLIDAGMTKQDCLNMLLAAGIKPPRMYDLGYPNANCIGCVKASSPTYWKHVKKVHVNIFHERAKQSRQIGCKLVRCHPMYLPFCSKHADGLWYDDRSGKCLHIRKKGKMVLNSPRIFLDELPDNAKGQPMKSMRTDCSAFCETRIKSPTPQPSRKEGAE